MLITYKFLFYAFLVENVICFVKRISGNLENQLIQIQTPLPLLLPNIKFDFSQECWEAEKKELRKPNLAKAIRAFMCWIKHSQTLQTLRGSVCAASSTPGLQWFCFVRCVPRCRSCRSRCWNLCHELGGAARVQHLTCIKRAPGTCHENIGDRYYLLCCLYRVNIFVHLFCTPKSEDHSRCRCERLPRSWASVLSCFCRV